MLLDVKAIRVTPGASLPFELEFDLSGLDFFGEHYLKEPVKTHGEVRNRAGVLEMRAEAEAVVDTVCARCLKPVHKTVTVKIRQPFATQLQDEENDDILLITDDRIDVDDVVIQAIVLNLDRVYLCSPDCKGLCPRCGADLNEGPCSCEEQ